MNETTIQRVGIIGAGAFGTALAQTAARHGLQVTLWARRNEIVAEINENKTNTTYLPDITLDSNIIATHDLKRTCQQDVVIVALPTQHIADTLAPVAAYTSGKTPLLLASKGIEISTGRLVAQIVAGILPDNPVGVLTGPNFAIEVARNLPAALTLAMNPQDQELALQLCETLSTPHFRIYADDDMIGAQIGGAVKNVIAIACGIAHGKNMGDNARAALMTRGLAEMMRLGAAMGADPVTFSGLSGVGDLTLTCSAMQSRNFSLGVAIGQGQRAADVLASRPSIAEGYYTADAVVKLADRLNIDMPICSAIHETLHKEKAIDYVIKGLLGRPVKPEKTKISV